MKKPIHISALIILILVTIFSLTSCGKSEESYIKNQTIIGNYNGCFFENKYFYFTDNLVYFSDLDSGDTGVLCSKPDCKHSNARNSSCPASGGEGSISRIIYSDDVIYEFVSAELNTTVIYKYDYQNAEQKKLCEFDGALQFDITDVVLANDKLFFAPKELDVDENMKTTEIASVCVYDLKENKLYRNQSVDNATISAICVYDEKVYYQLLIYDNMENSNKSLRCFDYKNNEDKLIRDKCIIQNSYENITSCYTYEDTQSDLEFCKFDMQNEEFSEFSSKDDLTDFYCYAIYNKKSILRKDGDNNEIIHYVYDFDTEKLTEIGEVDCAILFINDKYVVYGKSNIEGNYSATEYSLTENYINGKPDDIIIYKEYYDSMEITYDESSADSKDD